MYKKLLSIILVVTIFLACVSCTPEEISQGSEQVTENEITSAPAVTEYTAEYTISAAKETLENFPVPIILDGDDKYSEIFEKANDDASNLRVLDSELTELIFEIVSFDKESQTAELWVLLPEYRSDHDTVLTLSVSDNIYQQAARVWDYDYRLVLHMNGFDSSVYKNAITVNGSPSLVDGAVGKALSFDGEDDYLSIFNPWALVSEEADIPINNAYSDTGYVKPASWEYSQGLTSDGEYFYFVGHHDKENAGSSIHKIRMSDMTEVAVFEKVGPMHGAEIDYNYEDDTLFACTGGNGRSAAVWELDINDGKQIGVWDFAEIGYGGAALVTYLGGRDILLFTSIEDGAKIAFAHITLGESGKYTVKDEWSYTKKDLGVPQGLDTLSVKEDGTLIVYYLADAGSSVTVDPHYIYKIELASEKPLTVSEWYHISIKEETEGLCLIKSSDGSTEVYFGTNAEKIYKFDNKLAKLQNTSISENNAASPNAFTISFFVEVNDQTHKYPNILGFGSSSNSNNRFSLHLMQSNPGKLRFGTTLNAVWTKLDTKDGTLNSDGKLHHIAATYDGNSMKLYIDGKLNASMSVSGLLTDYGSPFTIGADIEKGIASYFFNGIVDEVRLYSGVRSDSWIAEEARMMK